MKSLYLLLAILGAIPFALVMLIQIAALLRSLREERE